MKHEEQLKLEGVFTQKWRRRCDGLPAREDDLETGVVAGFGDAETHKT